MAGAGFTDCGGSQITLSTMVGNQAEQTTGTEIRRDSSVERTNHVHNQIGLSDTIRDRAITAEDAYLGTLQKALAELKKYCRERRNLSMKVSDLIDTMEEALDDARAQRKIWKTEITQKRSELPITPANQRTFVRSNPAQGSGKRKDRMSLTPSSTESTGHRRKKIAGGTNDWQIVSFKKKREAPSKPQEDAQSQVTGTSKKVQL